MQQPLPLLVDADEIDAWLGLGLGLGLGFGQVRQREPLTSDGPRRIRRPRPALGGAYNREIGAALGWLLGPGPALGAAALGGQGRPRPQEPALGSARAVVGRPFQPVRCRRAP